ncbi:MAG: HK97 family phage prohead protease, partial [Nitrospira sp. WS238]|nr:HK97 family phage prohead protease [Nitrospira sp. WS238]
MTIERRILSGTLTFRGVGNQQKLVGHAAVFNRDSELIAGSFIERIAPG